MPLVEHICLIGDNNTDNLSTLTMVFILVGVVKGVFICFALVAVCYRYLYPECLSKSDVRPVHRLFKCSRCCLVYIYLHMNYINGYAVCSTIIYYVTPEALYETCRLSGTMENPWTRTPRYNLKYKAQHLALEKGIKWFLLEVVRE